MDVINQTWSPIYELVNIFRVFLPQLLLYPNATDPLNSEAASLYMNDQDAYKSKILGKGKSSKIIFKCFFI